MAIMLTVAMPVWHQTMQREKEEELIFRGKQYARAVGLFQRKYAGGYPPSIDVLVQQKVLGKKYKDPMVEDGEFQLSPAGAMQAGQVGPSLSTTTPTTRTGETSFRLSASIQASQRIVSVTTQTVMTGAIIGVVSKSTDKSIRLYNGRNHYNEWLFVYTAPAGRGAVAPGGRGGRGQGQGQGRGDQLGPGGSYIVEPTGPGRGQGGRGRGGLGPGGRGGTEPTQLPPGRGRGRGGTQ